jgi:PLP dependent protein
VLFPDVQAILDLPNLRVHGLMTMPPLGPSPEDSRRFFQRLRRLRDRLAETFPQAGWRELSMGTSADYALAVEEGATLVRVGTAIVGARRYTSEKEA